MSSCLVAAKPVREISIIDRRAEFFSEGELEKQLGQRKLWWAAVLVAELVDNALDHCEEAYVDTKRLPTISVVVTESSITVSDNGKGIPEAVVCSMTDYNTRTSNRVGYACPTRGAQGNAAKCLFAVPYVLNGISGEVEIDAVGVRHRIRTTMDVIAGIPVVEHSTEPGKVQFGTSVKVQLASLAGDDGVSRIVSLLREYSVLNRHAEFFLDFFGDTQHWSRTSETIEKWTARNPDPAHWYSQALFENQIAACIHRDRGCGKSRTVREFVRQFAGFKRSDIIKTLLDQTGMARCDLSSLGNAAGIDHEKALRLLEVMKGATEPPKVIKLGVIGKAHLESVLGSEMKYKRCAGVTADGLPFIVEAAFAERVDNVGRRRLFSGVNFSADVRLPAFESLVELLTEFWIYDGSPVDVVLHITTPSVKYTNRGKSQIDFCAVVKEVVRTALQAVSKEFTAQMKAEERDASRARKDSLRQDQKPSQVKLNAAINRVMEESVKLVSGGGKCDFPARNHFYAVRPLIQPLTKDNLTQSYLDRVIDAWECKHGIIEKRKRDPRGFLLEPHTGKQIPLGTRQVDEYVIPMHLYHTVIYVEKKGLLSNFQYGQIAEKYDVAIICAEGYAVRAAQSLMQAARNGHSMKGFVFHDADPAGYGIAKAIGVNSGAHKFDFEIIDAGLRLQEALDMGLQTETFTRLKALPKAIELTDTERRLFEGEWRPRVKKNGKQGSQWINCQRVELNALAVNPDLFVEWVEKKLQEHGAAKKYIPVENVVKERMAEKYRCARRERIREALVDALDIDSMVDEINGKLPAQPEFKGNHKKLVNWAKKLEPRSWSSVCDSMVNEALDRLNERIEEAVSEMQS